MPEPSHNSPGGRPSPGMPLSERAGLWARGFQSMIRRYPSDIIRAIRGHAGAIEGLQDEAAGPQTMREKWASLVETPEVSGLLWLGHCSVLLKVGGKTILTDPVLSPVIGPRVGMGRLSRTLGPTRLDGVSMKVRDLPPPDIILLSHAHYDHLDRPTLRSLASEWGKRVTVITAAKTRSLVPRGFASVIELPWGKRLTHDGLAFESLRPNHWGARNAWDRHRGYNSYLIENDAEAGSRVLFAGDTAATDAYRALRKGGPIDLAIFGIGAYDPWRHAHATPEEVWEMAREMQARTILPVHYGTFKLSNEPREEPLARLVAAAGGEIHRVLALKPGELATGLGGQASP